MTAAGQLLLTPVLATGRVITDEETGLIPLAYRYYGPAVGRFLSRDPIRYEGGPLLYVYGGNIAASLTNERGLQNPLLPGGLIVACVFTIVLAVWGRYDLWYVWDTPPEAGPSGGVPRQRRRIDDELDRNPYAPETH
ncbi:MAG: hypothetical protein IT204_22175 [Fimbriimonadaceae bacterium]|nr:hypothetical protein [Fimbriimonadaceae bacterium]